MLELEKFKINISKGKLDKKKTIDIDLIEENEIEDLLPSSRFHK